MARPSTSRGRILLRPGCWSSAFIAPLVSWERIRPLAVRVGSTGPGELVVAGTRYIIPYRVRPELDRIEILRVFHASRRLPGRW